MNPIALFVLSEFPQDPDKDTSYLFMLEAQKRGFHILIGFHKDIDYTYDRKEKKINIPILQKAFPVQVLERDDVGRVNIYGKNSSDNCQVFTYLNWKENIKILNKDYIYKESDNEILDYKLVDSKVIFMRSDPPVDDDYLDACTILESIKDEVLIVNDPSSLISFNEKLCTLAFPEIIPKTFIFDSPNVDELRSCVKGFPNGAVLKPINLCGGEGIQRFSYDDYKSLVVEDQPYIVQEFINEVYDGDKRVLLLNGEPIGAILRKAQDGNFICNFHSGGTPHKTEINSNDLRICNEIKSFLIDNNIFFAGIDIIGDRLTEINITSPTCVQEINRANRVKLEENVLDFIIHKLDKELVNAS
ncbi:MAG: hypothetical protein VW832_01665 [bacterium]